MVNTQSKNSLIADRYAEALVELVNSGKLTIEKVSKDLNTIEEILKDSSDLDAFLVNPIVSLEDKKEILEKVFSEEIDALMVNFLKVLVDKSRFSVFADVIVSFRNALDKINNVERVHVTSAVDLSEDVRTRLKQKLEGKLHKSVTLDWELNPEIIAGLVIRIGDNVIDTSLRHKLDDMTKNIVK